MTMSSEGPSTNSTNGSDILDYSTHGDPAVIAPALSTTLITIISLMIVFGK